MEGLCVGGYDSGAGEGLRIRGMEGMGCVEEQCVCGYDSEPRRSMEI